MAEPQLHAVVIGSGIGGLCAAARLSAAGARVQVVEQAPRLGGRLGTRVVDGFVLSTGAVALALGDDLQEAFDLVGAPFDVVQPDPSVVIRVAGRDVGSGGMVWKQLARGATASLERLTRSLRSTDHESTLTVADWLATFGRNRAVAGLFESMCHTIYTARPDQTPIRELSLLLRRTGGFKEFGFAPRGNDVLVAGLVDALRERGVEFHLDTRAERIEVVDGEVVAAHVVGPDGSLRLETDVVLSDAGPTTTAALVDDDASRAAFEERVRDVVPARYLSMYVASQFDLTGHPGLLTLTDFDRASSVGCLSAAAPDLAPSGWNLYVTGTVPEGDVAEETERMLDDLRQVNPEFLTDDRSRVVQVQEHHLGEDPGHRTLPGSEVPVTTPVTGLFEVGDGAKPPGFTGTSGAAAAARLGVEAALTHRSAQRPRS